MTKFGGFLDSTIDRYSESLVYGGVLVYLLGTRDYRLGSLLIIVATAGSLLISYARARAEAAGFRASVGLLARPERAHPRRWTAHGICHPGAVDSRYWHPSHGRDPHGPRLAPLANDRAASGLKHGRTRRRRWTSPATGMKPPDDLDADSVLSSPADIESAGRSCMAILVLAAVILLLLCVWIGLRSTGAGQ